MIKIIKMIKTDYRDRMIIGELYKHQTTSIKINGGKREAVIRKGLGQGWNLPPLVFNIHTEQAINECKEYSNGIDVNGVRGEMIRFAYHIAIIAQD